MNHKSSNVRFAVTQDEWIVNYDRPEPDDESFCCEKEPGILWIMGGNIDHIPVDTTYLLSEPEGFQEGPSLPFGLRASCATAINRTHTFMTGKKAKYATLTFK